MPPLATWFRGREAISIFLPGGRCRGDWRWRRVHARANGQPAFGCYTWDDDEEAYLPFCLDVLTLDGGRIADVTAFVAMSHARPRARVLRALDRAAARPRRVAAVFERFGLPEPLE